MSSSSENLAGTRGGAPNAREGTIRQVVRRLTDVLKVQETKDQIDLGLLTESPDWEASALQAGSRQVGIQVQSLSELSLIRALDILHAGHAVVVLDNNLEYVILERRIGGKVEVSRIDSTVRSGMLSRKEVGRLLDSARALFVAKSELTGGSLGHGDSHDASGEHPPPLKRFWGLLKLDIRDVWTVVLFALVSGVLALATPLAIESLVNVVSWGTYVQPLIVLSIILLASLGLAGILKILQTVVVEIIQRRQFVRIVGDLAHRLPRANRAYLKGHYPRELANRVFDIMTIQKATAVLLLDGVSIVLSTCLGMILLSFYHPYLLGFNLALLITMVSITWLLGRHGIHTSIDESIAKYKIVHWLQDVISFPFAFKINGGEELAIAKANRLAADYLHAREQQFRVVIRQVTFAIGLQVIASTILLGLGGWLVIDGSLTLGQLVASELVVTIVVGAFAKAGKSLEKFYDLMAGIDKVGHLLDLRFDPRREQIRVSEQPAKLEWTDLRIKVGPNTLAIPAGSVEAGQSVAVVGDDTAAKTLFCNVVAGLVEPDVGYVTIDEMYDSEAAFASEGRLISVAIGAEVFHGTIAENISLGRPGIGLDRSREVLRAVGLLQAVHELPDAMETNLQTDGYPLSREQAARVSLAQALAARPRLLVVDGVLDWLPASERESVWTSALKSIEPSTAVLITNDSELAHICDRQIRIDRN